MRKLDKFIIWPVYFDFNRTRREGRRVPKSLAVISPKIFEIKEAADKLGLKNEANPEARHPKKPWFNSGMLLVEKREAKEEIIQDLAKHLQKIRSQQATQLAKR